MTEEQAKAALKKKDLGIKPIKRTESKNIKPDWSLNRLRKPVKR